MSRTTLTLDPDVVRLIEEEVNRLRKPFKHVANDALRRGLTPDGRRTAVRRYRVRPHAAKLLPGIDPGRLNALADALEHRVAAAPRRRRRTP